MKEYIYLIHPLRHEFFESPTPFELEMIEAHFDYLKQAVSDGKVVLAGPCLDQTFGVIIFRSENDEAAREFMLNDPSVKNNMMMAELHPMRISLLEGH